MKTFCFLAWVSVLAFCVCLSGCSFMAGQLKDKADEERLLKPGALDPAISRGYETYSYKILGRYVVSHDWIKSASPCHYNAIYSNHPTNRAANVARDGDVYEQGNHTFQEFFQSKYPERSNSHNYLNIDRYVRPEWQSTDGYGNVRTNKGFQPMCFEAWGGTSHVLAIKLFKKDVATWKSELEKINPAGKFNEEVIGKNTWLVQRNEIAGRQINSVGGAYLHYTTPIGDTGYTLTIQLGANQDSLKYPEAHARMQEVFRHLVESVKIEPIDANAK